jgi:hypothetical protein
MNISTLGAGVDRRSFLLGAAGALAGAGLVRTAWPAPAQANSGPVPLPNPIPGGLPIGLPAPYDLIHVWLPGDPSITLPFSGLPLMGFDVDPITITDFSGEAAMGFFIGSAMGSDGVEYGVEIDLRVANGRYIAADGSEHFGLFALT